MALPATTLRVGATSRRDEAAPCGVYELSRRAALWAERRWLVSCAGYESCAEDSAEPVPRARPTTLSASGGGLALVHLGLSSQEPIAPRRIVRAPQPTAPRRLPQLHQTDG